MDQQSIQYLKANPKLATFVRYNPVWYRYLSREPERIKEMEKEAKIFYDKTLPQQISTLNDRIQMISMLTEVAKAMKD